MFFFISKIFSFVLSPFVWAIVLLIAGLLTARPGMKKKLLVSGVLILLLCGNSFLVDECFRQWEPVTQDYDTSSVKYDGAIILGGLGDIDLRLRKINFGRSGDRLFQTLPLYYS